LKRIRKAAGLTLREVAAPYVSAPTVFRYEEGQRNLDQLVYLVMLKRSSGETWDTIMTAIEAEMVSLLGLKD
jgi:transcriptional regulator with XRE-family HTH domain